MTKLPAAVQNVYVLKEKFDKGGQDLLDSSTDFLVELMERTQIANSEMSEVGTMSYLVSFFRSQVLEEDGLETFLQTIFPFDVAMPIIRGALAEMKASEYLHLFDDAQAVVTTMGKENYEKFRRGEFTFDDETKKRIDQLNERFRQLDNEHSLTDYNAQWLSHHPRLVILSASEREEKLDELTKEISIAQESENPTGGDDSRAAQIALALSKLAHLDFEQMTSMEPRLQIEGESVLGFNFVTKQGAYFFYEHNGEAIMHEQVSMNPVCRLELSERFSSE